MTEPVNLNRFRKERLRAEKRARADQNSAAHGLGKPAKTLAKRNNLVDEKRLEDHKRDAPTAPKSPK